ncbi:DUF4870 domain-containing protein [Tahibacter sp. P2K]|uniref:DUF4870 domain-containing protein n=2 Tax=Tahibacter harae TaxID=2963937 RepID=A0ABT1QSQ8_9GAMM|nr:DUF4870 domain-containing protein [Tahibacter harae]MCQ4165331.1 DUF4870 domain-containing protein [Tahibacter harae]
MSTNETGPDLPPVQPPPPPQAAPPPPPPLESGAAISAEERQWAMFAHLSALLGGILTGAFGGLGVFIGPLVIWLMKKETMPFVDDQGKEALNFNITVAIACLALVVLSVVTLGIGLLIAVPLFLVIAVAWLVFTIIATIKANEGVAYRYPLCLRLVN